MLAPQISLNLIRAIRGGSLFLAGRRYSILGAKKITWAERFGSVSTHEFARARRDDVKLIPRMGCLWIDSLWPVNSHIESALLDQSGIVGVRRHEAVKR